MMATSLVTWTALAWAGPGLRASPASRVAPSQMVASEVRVGVKRNPNMAKLNAG